MPFKLIFYPNGYAEIFSLNAINKQKGTTSAPF